MSNDKPAASAERMAAIADYANVVANAHTQIYHPTFYFGDGYDAGHARALKEMGAELLKSRMFYEHLATNEASKAQVLSEQLAAAELSAGEYEKALKKVIAVSHSWVITRETGFIESPIHAKYRDIASKVLEKK